MTKRKAIIAQTRDGRYIFAVYSEAGFTEYRITKNQGPYWHTKIRKWANALGADLPRKIDWDSLPIGNRIEKLDGEPEARVVS